MRFGVGRALVGLVATLWLAGVEPAFAQANRAEARAEQAGRRVNELKARNPEAARDLAWRTGESFRREGRADFAGRFALQAAKIDLGAAKPQRIVRDVAPRLASLLGELDADGGDELLGVVMDAQGRLDDRTAQDETGRRLVERVAAREGEASENAMLARLRVASSFFTTAGNERGRELLLAALRKGDADGHAEMTIFQYRMAAEAFAAVGNMEMSISLLDEAMRSRSAKVESQTLALTAFLRADYLRKTARFEEGVPAATDARKRLQAQFGPDSGEAVMGGDVLASMLIDSGAVASGLNLSEEVYLHARKALGDDIPMTWRTANNYAEALRVIGRPEAAAPIDEELLEKRIRRYGRASIQALVSSSNLALDRLAMGDEAGAMKYFALQRQLGKELADPTSEHEMQGKVWLDYARAFFNPRKKLTDDAVEAFARIKDWSGAPDLMRVMATQLAAELYERRGESERGLKLRIEARDICAKAFGASHPRTFDATLGVAKAQGRRGDEAALATYAALEKEVFAWMIREVGGAGNRHVAEITRGLADDVLFAFGEYALENPQAATAYAAAVARWKSMEDGARTRLRQLADTLEDDEARKLARLVMRLMGQQQELLSSGKVDEGTQRMLDRLGGARAALRTKLREAGENHLPPVDPQAALIPGDALVDFFATAPRSAPGAANTPDPKLHAIVHRSGAAPAVVDLGYLSEILQTGPIPGTGAERIARIHARMNLPLEARFAFIHARLVEPLATYLEGAGRLFVAPDAELFSLPFSMLRDKAGRHLDEIYELRILTRTDALQFATAQQTLRPDARATLVGGLDFNRDGVSEAPALPQSATEVDKVAASLSDAGVSIRKLVGAEGTEASVRAGVEGARIVHFATHGFFRPATGRTDALWRSGLVLARAGKLGDPKPDPDDGVLYAHELMDWDLSAADLVTLSACETGRGDTSRLASVRGLPTALAIAGARRAIVTLWAVADEGAANFMARFYRLAASGRPYPQALRETRLAAIRGEIAGAADPSLWAAFALYEN